MSKVLAALLFILAAVMGHEIAQALREHGRERVSQACAQSIGLAVVGVALGMSDPAIDLSRIVLDVTFNLPDSRTDEQEADRIGVELAARAARPCVVEGLAARRRDALARRCDKIRLTRP